MRYPVKDRKTGEEVGCIIADNIVMASHIFYITYTDKSVDVFMTDQK